MSAISKPIWANVPGVSYPPRTIWASIPGVEFPRESAPCPHTVEQRQKRSDRREKTLAARRQRAADNAARKAQRIATLVALFDSGKTIEAASAELRMCPYNAGKILRSLGRKIRTGRPRKTNAPGLAPPRD